MGSGDERRLREVVTEVTAAAGYDLEELLVRSAGRRRVIRVVIDADGGVSLDAAAEISRRISERLDAFGDADPAGSAPYTLEITSPGIGRPLTQPRHYRRARTRLVALVTTDGRSLTGHVVTADDTSVRLVRADRKGVSQLDVPYAEIARAKVEVEFSRPSAAVLQLLGIDPAAEPDLDPADDDGADDDGADDDGADDDDDEADDGIDGDDDIDADEETDEESADGDDPDRIEPADTGEGVTR